jgi:hypothetical protein
VSTIPELVNFESDIKELLGVRRVNPRTYDGPNARSYAFMFVSLIGGMISVKGDSDRGEYDFRLKLINRLLDLIWHEVQRLKILDSQRATSIVLGDIGRTRAWTEMLASRVNDEYDLSKLSPRYDKKELDSCKNEAEQKKYIENIDKKTLEDFEKYANENIPHRSFNFDTKKLIE